MDIKILDSWLKDYLEINTTSQKIAECLSLSGPSVEKVEKVGDDSVYNFEVTTNRVDTASVYGIAREAAAILPRFKIPAKLKPVRTDEEIPFSNNVSYLEANVDKNLCPRFAAILIKNVKIDHSPDWMTKRLEASGVRAINNIVDISNYIMLALGQPVHTFDYDKITGAKMVLRQSHKGEKITTLDGKEFTLAGGDIVIEDGEGRLIDLAGIMGGALSMVDENTKNVLLFVQTYNPANIRKTSMALAQRTQAATIFEKGIDPELVTPAIYMGIKFFKDICKGEPAGQILNIYPTPFKPKTISLNYSEITKRVGLVIPKGEITEILRSLRFEVLWKKNVLSVSVPSFRTSDIATGEDIIEEIARIFGYHNLPSQLMTGEIPAEPRDRRFIFEDRIKDLLSGWGGIEVYTLSLVSKEMTPAKALKLKNPLGAETEFLRISLMPSLIAAAGENIGINEKFHLFEMANIYLPKVGDLPQEKMILAGIFSGYEYRAAKGIVEALLIKLNIKAEFLSTELAEFSASKSAVIKSWQKDIGIIGLTDNNLIYYEFSLEGLFSLADKNVSYKEISKFPSQIEDITFTLPEKTKIGDVIGSVLIKNKTIESFELTDTYESSYTFRVHYHSDEKTLTDKDVEEVRKQITALIKAKFGGTEKS